MPSSPPTTPSRRWSPSSPSANRLSSSRSSSTATAETVGTTITMEATRTCTTETPYAPQRVESVTNSSTTTTWTGFDHPKMKEPATAVPLASTGTTGTTGTTGMIEDRAVEAGVAQPQDTTHDPGTATAAMGRAAERQGPDPVPHLRPLDPVAEMEAGVTMESIARAVPIAPRSDEDMGKTELKYVEGGGTGKPSTDAGRARSTPCEAPGRNVQDETDAGGSGRGSDGLDEADQLLDSINSGSSSGGSSSSDASETPTFDSENPFRPGSRTSMYPELFQQMVCTVLESESYLFSNAELDLLSAFFMLPYAARYLFVRLLQRKKDAWYRLDRLSAYEQEIGDLCPAKEALARYLEAADPVCPKMEHAQCEEQSRRFAEMQEDRENVTLTLPELQRNLQLDEASGLLAMPPLPKPSSHGKTPLTQTDDNISVRSNPTNTADAKISVRDRCSSLRHPLTRFVRTEADMEGGVEESLSLLTLEELKTLARKLNVAKPGTTRASIIAALMATKSQATLFESPSPKKKSGGSGNGGGRQLTLNFGSSGKKTVQASRLKEELGAVLRGGCIQVAPEVRSLIDRVALVYYRGNLLGSAALTVAILARSQRRNYPLYGLRRSSFLFPSRDHLIAFERALDVEARLEQLIQFGKSERDHREALRLFESVYQEWQTCVDECTRAHPEGVDKLVYHRMRFHPGWILSRVIYKGAACLARFKLYDREREVLVRLLGQRLFRRGRRGDWYDRLALITALYSADPKQGKKEALQISIRGIQDPDTHLIYHDTLQRRIGRLESQLRIPRSEQHDFSYAKLKRSTEVVFKGTRLDVMLDRDADVANSHGSRLNGFLRRPSASPSPKGARHLKRSGTDRDVVRGMLLVKGQEPVGVSPLGPPSGFQVRRPLYKRVKVETFTTGAAVTPSVVEKGEAGETEQRDPTVQAEGVFDAVLRPPHIKREDGDEVADEVASLRDGDPTAFALGLASAEAAPVVEVRTETRASMRSVWRGLDGRACHVEQLCLQHYAQQGFQGVHCEGKILTMLFVLAMWDVLFDDTVEGAFETPFQAAPLDLASDAFAIVRSQPIRQRLDEIERTGGLHLISRVDDAQRPRKTWAVGCWWDRFSKRQLLEVAECLGGRSLAVVCQMFCEEWEHCTGGMPDLCVWRMSDRCCRFVEVKGPGDRLSETQKVWIDVLLRAGIDVQVGLVVEG
ncbi:hypothetical protein ACQY0O_001592 [Thecaphora frezii]